MIILDNEEQRTVFLTAIDNTPWQGIATLRRVVSALDALEGAAVATGELQQIALTFADDVARKAAADEQR